MNPTALLASGLAVLLIVLGELAPRLIALPQTLQQDVYARDTANPGLYRLDDSAGYVMAPNYRGRLHSADFDQSFQTNSRGLRDAEPGQKLPNEFRIVVVGDSFVMGAEVPVEQRFTNQLESLLHARGYTSVRVMNVGVRGWGTYNEAGYLREDVDVLQPDLVVLSVFAGNIGENVLATAAGYELRGGGIAYGPPAQALEGDSVTWFDHNFWSGAAEYAPPARSDDQWSPTDGLPIPRGNTLADPTGGASAYVPGSVADAARTWLRKQSLVYRGLADDWFRMRHGYDRPDPLMVDNWLGYTLRASPHVYWYELAMPLTAHYIDQARVAAASVGAPLAMMIIPRDAQVDATKLSAQLAQYHLRAEEVDVDLPQRQLTLAAEQLGVPSLDLEPALRAVPDRSQLFYAHDIHFTWTGHLVAAETLADWLERIGLVPSGL